MVSEEEATRCIKRGDYHVIRPMLPELLTEEELKIGVLNKEFSSADTVLDLPGTKALLKKHGLMVEDVNLHKTGELLR
jgi:hypothetical protein